MKLPTLKWFILPALTMMLLLGALLIYYYRYVPAKLMYFSNRNFRVLSVMSTQISSRIENLAVALQNAGEAGNVSKVITLVPNLTLDKNSDQDQAILNGKSQLTEIDLIPRQVGASVRLYFTYKGQVVKSKNNFSFMAWTDFTELMRPIAGRDVFDDVLVAQKDGKRSKSIVWMASNAFRWIDLC